MDHIIWMVKSLLKGPIDLSSRHILYISPNTNHYGKSLLLIPFLLIHNHYVFYIQHQVPNAANLTVTLRKSLPPTLRTGPVGPRVLILRTCHVIESRMNTELIAYSKRSCNIKSNFHFRFPFPVKAVFKISFPV